MNKLSIEKRVQILSMLCEGSSMRAVSRVCDVSINTVTKLLVDAGTACAEFHDKSVRGVKAKDVQADEIWSFCYAKAKNVPTAKAAPDGAGDVWTWTALDRDSKLLVSFFVGDRDSGCATLFMEDLASRLDGRIQLSTDGHSAYPGAVDSAFGSQIDYGQIVKVYGSGANTPETRYSPAQFKAVAKCGVSGKPNFGRLSTSHVERSNLSFRMHNRRFTRLTNGHSKKLENHVHMIALYTVWYNFARINSAIRCAPAMQAGLSKSLWTMTDLANMVEAASPAPAKRGSYKKHISN